MYDSHNRVSEVWQGPAGATSLLRKMIYDDGSENRMGRLSAIEYQVDSFGRYKLREA